MKTSDNYRPTLVTGPTSDSVTLEQAKKQCELADSDTAHDQHLSELIDRARQEFESDCDMCIASQTWKLIRDDFQDGMQLQKGPIQSITSIKYYDTSGVLTTLPTTIYNFDIANRRIRLQYFKIVPLSLLRWDAWEFIYLCGFATPPGIAVQAMLMLIEKYWLGRELREPNFARYQNLVLKKQRSTYP